MTEKGSRRGVDPVAPGRRAGELEARQGFAKPPERAPDEEKYEGRAVLPQVEGKTLRLIRVETAPDREGAEPVAPTVEYEGRERRLEEGA